MSYFDDIRGSLNYVKGAVNRQQHLDSIESLSPEDRAKIKEYLRTAQYALSKAVDLMTAKGATGGGWQSSVYGGQKSPGTQARRAAPTQEKLPEPAPKTSKPRDTAHPWREET